MDTLDNANATNPFTHSNNDDVKQKEEYVMNIEEGFKHNGSESLAFLRGTNGKRLSHEFDVDDDLGPETDVDTIEDVLLSTTVLSAKTLMDEIVNNSSLCEKEKATIETDSELIKKQNIDELENLQFIREETPTPPVDLVRTNSASLVYNSTSEIAITDTKHSENSIKLEPFKIVDNNLQLVKVLFDMIDVLYSMLAPKKS